MTTLGRAFLSSLPFTNMLGKDRLDAPARQGKFQAKKVLQRRPSKVRACALGEGAHGPSGRAAD